MKKFLLIIAAVTVGILPHVAFAELHVSGQGNAQTMILGYQAADIAEKKDGDPYFDIRQVQTSHPNTKTPTVLSSEMLPCGDKVEFMSDGTYKVLPTSGSGKLSAPPAN